MSVNAHALTGRNDKMDDDIVLKSTLMNAKLNKDI
jgi:hypothetical protein